MSTTIKRVALVAVAALGLGVISVAPSQAAAQLDSISISASTATQTAGETLTAGSAVVTGTLAAQKGVDTLTVTASIVSGPAYIQPILVLKETTTAVSTGIGSGTSAVSVVPLDTTTVTQATAKFSVYLNAPTVSGTYVVKLTPTGTPNATAVTVAITVAPKVIGWTTAYLAADTTTAAVADGTDVSAAAAANILSVARITVAQGYGSVAGVDTATTAADTKDVVVTVTKGLVSKTNDYTAGAKSVTTAAATAAPTNYYIFSNGDVGASTVSISIGGAAAVTKTVTFKGAAATLSATPTTAAPFWATVGKTTETTTITAKDSAGSTVGLPSGLTVTTSDSSVVTAAISNGVVTFNAKKAGDATVTVTDPATTAAASAVTFPIHVAPVKSVAAPVVSFDKSAYAVGELVTMTISADIADSATATLFSTALVYSAGNIVWSGTAGTGTTHAVVGGKVTYKFYAPAVSGTFTVSATTGASVDLTTAATVTKTVDILNPGVDAATDAANEASAAASDATDAALAAADAADAATAAAQDAVDAVAALSAQVNKLISALKAQITTLTNLVIKIQKKVKA
jgi:hypothetical protein